MAAAPARGGFRPLTPQPGRHPLAQNAPPKPKPIVPPTAPSEQNEFKPLSTTIMRESMPKQAANGAGVRFNSDFSTPTPTGAEMPYRQPQAERAPVSQQPPSGEPDFTPGIISRPAVRQSRRSFQWNELDNGQ